MNVSNEAIQALKEHIGAAELEKKIIRFFNTQGCCGPSVQMSLEDEKTTTDEFFIVDGVNFSMEPSIITNMEPVTLIFNENGFQLQGYTSSGCC